MQTQVNLIKQNDIAAIREYAAESNCELSLIYFNAAIFNSVYWFDEIAAVTHDAGTQLDLAFPKLPAHRCCVFDCLASERLNASPAVLGCDKLPCGMLYGCFRLRYYMGIWETANAAEYFIHPEFDRPLTEFETEKLYISYARAQALAKRWLENTPLIAGNGAEFDCRNIEKEIPIFNYANRIKTKHLIAGGRVVLC
jgi:hypothetical protein